MAVNVCGFARVMALESEAASPLAPSEGNSTCWSLCLSTACPALVHGSTMASGFSVLLVLTVNSHYKSLSYVHSPLRDNKNSCGHSSGMQETQNCQIPASLDWPSHCLCFAAVPKCSWGLLRTQVSPRNGKGLPCSWNPPNKAELSIILNQGFVTAKQGL